MCQKLEDEEYSQNGQHGSHDFFCVVRNLSSEQTDHILNGSYLRDFHHAVYGILRVVEDAKHLYCQNRADTADSDQTEAVIRPVFITSGCGKTNSKTHDKRYCHRSGGYAARIKGDCRKISRRQKRDQK